jgi:hypothetical protein
MNTKILVVKAKEYRNSQTGELHAQDLQKRIDAALAEYREGWKSVCPNLLYTKPSQLRASNLLDYDYCPNSEKLTN